MHVVIVDGEEYRISGGVVAIGADGKPLGGSAIPSGELHIGEVSTPADVVSLVPVLDTGAYGDGDVLFATTAIPNAVRVTGGQAVLQSLALIDKADNGAAIDLYFFDSNVALGTFNVAPSISDANALKLLGVISIGTGDYKDVGGAKVATLRGLGLLLEAASGRNLYVAATVAGTPTFAADDITIRFGFLW